MFATPAATTATQPIPYRTDSPISAGQALSVFGVTIALLAVAVGVLLWVRKRGWIQRWSFKVGSGSANSGVPRVIGQTRVGQASNAFVIEVDGARFVLVESSRHVSLHALPGEKVPQGGDHD